LLVDAVLDRKSQNAVLDPVEVDLDPVILLLLVRRLGFGADLGAGYFQGLATQLEVRPLECLVFFLLGVGASVAATLGPAREAAAVPAAAALKAGDEAPMAARRHGYIALGLIVAALAALALPPMEGIALPGYTAIACLLLGAVFLVPGISHFVFRRLDVAQPAWLQIATAQLRGTARRSTVSIAAVLVSFGLMVAMAIMVYSFRNSLDAWMQRILPADVYVRAGSAGQSGFLDEEAQRRLSSIKGLARIDFVRFKDVALPDGGLPFTVIARPIDEASAADILPLRRTDPEPAPPGTVPVWASESALDLRGLDVGTVFELPLGGQVVRASVRGLWRDYERPGGSAVIPREVFIERTGDTRATTAAMWVEPGTTTDAVVLQVRELLPGEERYQVAVPREIRRQSLRVFDRTFAVTYLLEAVAVVIGLFGISVSTSSQVMARRGEFGMLRHLGVSRREIGRMLAFEGAALGAVGVVAGLVIGGIVSLILIYVVNRQSFHWTMDVHVPWGLLGVLSLTLVASAAAVAVLSGRQAMTGDVVRAVKEDW
jgi:putative ABC transport system permease protein